MTYWYDKCPSQSRTTWGDFMYHAVCVEVARRHERMWEFGDITKAYVQDDDAQFLTDAVYSVSQKRVPQSRFALLNWLSMAKEHKYKVENVETGQHVAEVNWFKPNPSYNWRPAIQWSTSTRSAISVNPGEREMDMQDYANDSSPRSTIMVLNDPTSSMHYQVVYMFGYRRGHYNLLYDPNVFKQEEAIGLTLSLVMNKEE